MGSYSVADFEKVFFSLLPREVLFLLVLATSSGITTSRDEKLKPSFLNLSAPRANTSIENKAIISKLGIVFYL